MGIDHDNYDALFRRDNYVLDVYLQRVQDGGGADKVLLLT